MKFARKGRTLEGTDGKIHLSRRPDGIPEIRAASLPDLARGLGWVHANDRQLHTLLTRILLQGRAAELLKGEQGLIAIDRYMKTMNFLPDPERVLAALEPAALAQLEAYAEGYNACLRENGTVYELRMMGYRAEPWSVRDSLLLGKVFGFLGLAESQAGMEKLLVQMVREGVSEPRLKELFPYLTEPLDRDLLRQVTLAPALVPEAVSWLGRLPRFNASNNWAVAGRLTASGKPILCGDPHLEVNRLPAIWQEIVMRLPDQDLLGVSLPGVPGLVLGRTRKIAWSATYSFMDMLDYRIERCRDGKYWRRDGWHPFRVREETILVRKGRPIPLKVYQNPHGILEGEPMEEGHRLVLGWSGHRDCGAGVFNGLLGLPHAGTVREAMAMFRKIDAASFNFVIVDTEGAIGYQMSGRLFERPQGVSGLLPLPGWETEYDPLGFVAPERLPSLYNPPEGFIVTANQDLNAWGQAKPINLPMGAYRADRIRQILGAGKDMDRAFMKRMHFDLHSLQAERLLEILRPLLPDTPNGRLLRDWDCRYESDSVGATLFESVYRALLLTVFGDHGLGREVMRYLLTETPLLNDYYANFDAILMKEDSAWFEGHSREEIFRKAVVEGLSETAVPYGKTRRVMLTHLLFGGKLPSFLGFDRGPVHLPGGRATIPQGQIFRSAGRVTTFSPSYRFIADMATGEIETTLAGGPSDRRFSPWYANDLENWVRGIYKVLR